MKLSLSKREVNLILGVISLLVLVSYIFFFYMPKNEDYKKRMETFELLSSQSKQIRDVNSDLQKLQENKSLYEAELNKIRPIPNQPNTPQLEDNVDHNSLIVTLEEIADRSQIDMVMRTPYENASSAISTPVNGETGTVNPDGTISQAIDQTNQELQNGGIAQNVGGGATNQAANELGVEGTTLGGNPTNDPAGDPNNPTGSANTVPLQGMPNVENQVPQQTNDGSYQFNILGEYRSIMIFLFELRNLEYKGVITNFEIKHNPAEGSKEIGFPLSATFNVKFSAKEGGVE